MRHNKKLKIFGCSSYVHNNTKRTKFDSKPSKGIFVGYMPNLYKIFIPKWEKGVPENSTQGQTSFMHNGCP